MTRYSKILQAEKRRYVSEDKGNTGERPPRPPVKPPPRQEGNASTSAGPKSTNGPSKGPARDQNFVSEDWDEDEEELVPRRGHKKSSTNDKQRVPVSTGPKADNGWLEDDFDDQSLV